MFQLVASAGGGSVAVESLFIIAPIVFGALCLGSSCM